MANNVSAQLMQNPEFAPQVQGLDRQRKMAEMLMTQGFQPQQGQMVSGHYVAPSWTQQLAGLANMAAGTYMQSQADEKQLDLAQALRNASQQELEDWMQASKGIPSQNVPQAGAPTDAMIENKQFALPNRIIPEQKPLDKTALALRAMGAQYNTALPGLGAELLKQQFKEPKWEKTIIVDPKSGNEVVGLVDVNSQNPESTFRPVGQGKPGMSQKDIMQGTYEGWYQPTSGGNQPNQGNQPIIGGNPSQTFTPVGNQKDFYNTMYQSALQKAKAMGAPNPEALATLAATQSSIETGSGKHLAGGNNFFGIKGGNNPQKTQEFDPTTGKMKTITDSFRQYGDMGQSVDDYLNLLKNNYPAAFNAKNPQEAFVGITSKNPRGMYYMTDPNYLGKLQSWNASLAGGTNQPVVGNQPQTGNQPQVIGNENNFAPKDIPQYQYDASISPKDNQTARAKFNADIQSSMKNAQNAFGIIKSASDILNANTASSGRGENIITGAKEFFGGGGESSKADAQLKVLGTKLTMMQPRFEGPQSDKDTAMYQAAAADIGNANIPIKSRLAALQEMVDINKKYYPKGEWDKIDLTGPVSVKNPLGGTKGFGAKTLAPEQFKKGLSKQDAEAFDWARKNPSDARANQILSRLGVE